MQSVTVVDAIPHHCTHKLTLEIIDVKNVPGKIFKKTLKNVTRIKNV